MFPPLGAETGVVAGDGMLTVTWVVGVALSVGAPDAPAEEVDPLPDPDEAGDEPDAAGPAVASSLDDAAPPEPALDATVAEVEVHAAKSINPVEQITARAKLLTAKATGFIGRLLLAAPGL